MAREHLITELEALLKRTPPTVAWCQPLRRTLVSRLAYELKKAREELLRAARPEDAREPAGGLTDVD